MALVCVLHESKNIQLTVDISVQATAAGASLRQSSIVSVSLTGYTVKTEYIVQFIVP